MQLPPLGSRTSFVPAPFYFFRCLLPLLQRLLMVLARQVQ